MRSEGKRLCATMMTCRKHKPLSSQDWAEEYGCKLIDTSPDKTGECKTSQVALDGFALLSTASTRLDEILMVIEEQQKELCQHHQEVMDVQSQVCDIHDWACDIQQHAIDIQECMSLALLDILHPSLLPPIV